MAPGDGQTVDEQFARLPKSVRRALEEKGLGLPKLREIALQDNGERIVQHILSEYSVSSSRWDFAGDRWTDESRTVWPWLRLLLVAVVGVVLCLLSTSVLDASALFVGAACGLAVVWAGFKTRRSTGGIVACGLVAAAYVVLIWMGSYAADEWYLQLRGQEATVTYATAVNHGSHGIRTLYCRVRLADGSVRQVFQNDDRCTDTAMVGTKTRAVIDPAGHYRPVLGSKSDIGGTVDGYVCLGAALVLVVAPLTAAFMSGRNESRGNRTGRVGGAVA